MRCLTLADTLTALGAECHFICREHSGSLIEYIRGKGYCVYALEYVPPQASIAVPSVEPQLVHSAWLGSTQAQDAIECAGVLSELQPDWLIVDHYALDVQWETALQPYYRKLMVIDDLADRVHVCHLLLDQNLGRKEQDYAGLVPDYCQIFVTPQFALLRPEFAELREYSLNRRANPQLKHLLITMGGVDQPNATCQVLEAMRGCPLPADCRITVVMGAAAPWLAQVQAQAALMPWPTEVLVNIDDMAQRMADSDLAIGAAGSTSWERCCLGLPSIVLVLADNQRFISFQLDRAGAASALHLSVDWLGTLHQLIGQYFKPENLAQMSAAAAKVCDGLGAQRIGNKLYEQ